MSEIIVSICLLAGAGFMVLAALGILRLPDLPTRMHASTKAGAMGAMLIMAGVAIHFAEVVVFMRALGIVIFILITAPIAAHVIGRAGYFLGAQLWEGTVKDELRDNYDPVTHSLKSGFEATPKRTPGDKTPESTGLGGSES